MSSITIVGLGAGDINQLPLGVYRTLKGDRPIYLRTKEHPVVNQLAQEGVKFTSFDYLYEEKNQFEDVYRLIVEELCKEAKDKDIIYAVPGHPMVAEKTVQLLIEKKDHDIRLEGGQSFLDALFQSVLVDPIEGFQLLDGTDIKKEEVQPTQHIIIGQVYDQMIASHVKLELMEIFPDSYEIYIITNAGLPNEVVKKLPLYELDHDFKISNLTSLYIPPVKDETILYKQFSYLRQVIATLRGPHGCPWDKKQTHESLKKYLLEEAYELLEAIDENDDDHIVEELGDVLLQVMLHAQIGEDEGYFTIDDVIESITTKMIHRHPHVFANVVVESASDVVSNWQKIKENEKGRRSTTTFSDIPKGLPALLYAEELQKSAKRKGFDWQEIEPVIEKVKEELNEWLDEIKVNPKSKRVQSEFGDLLFSMVNIARFLNINSEEALIQTNQKFIRRFDFVCEKVKETGKDFSEFTLEELDQFWNMAKENGL
ncbi:nucleoside triphosphate pyrophosphohydrolase [Caldibacillus thermolactis]|jgi:tetrapyrrole methylase family protein / MazG family protein|uniref:Nucleoside triphosphate pyrophosphohydrolase n=1 Tax=Pallidibacillus thermolactis TaxID=251051 RepID=A0ABT2WF71_9BACI|nr:nucleoside triphosphate pyrophosphohydrolase [Pallidibacillus thermolactis]MCU9594337.1 nucleoside triphosphate pyrophosphohydrolase [Pallidibacillus thermolactis]MCU9601560.1 nucleoside triphosphate pyrophosphohydrolase [Pallidibacillus thermolactis subsp. kokeshiiformis]MED1672509.1 nucleoside triphosphate pyrophosphohydrolase [Pallidibacillus thermolactis subsp. kokeshiiformis]